MLVNLPHVTPPHSFEIELRTICALIHLGDFKNSRVQKALLDIDKTCFYNFDLTIIFELIQELFNKQKPFDLVEISSLIPNEQFHIVQNSIKEYYLSTNNLENDCEKLLLYKLMRNMYKNLVNMINSSLEQTLLEESYSMILDNIQVLAKINNNSNVSIVRTYETIADEFLSNPNTENSQFIVDVPGLPPITNHSLITIAGRSGHGKTFFALYLMDKIIDQFPNKQTLYFNLEMNELDMMERHANLLGIQNKLQRETILESLSSLIPKNISLINEPMITIEQIETISRLASIKQPLTVIVVDYLGLIKTKVRHDRNDLAQSDIAKRLAGLSLELKCVVIALIQVNREFKTRPIGNRCPVTSDASESMGSVHSSSLWLGIDQPQLDDNSEEYQDLFQVACRKNRGKSGLFNLQLKFKNGMFSKWTRPFCSQKSKNQDSTPQF